MSKGLKIGLFSAFTGLLVGGALVLVSMNEPVTALTLCILIGFALAFGCLAFALLHINRSMAKLREETSSLDSVDVEAGQKIEEAAQVTASVE